MPRGRGTDLYCNTAYLFEVLQSNENRRRESYNNLNEG
jgi:hypothetical protein